MQPSAQPSGAEIFRHCFESSDFEAIFAALSPDFLFFHAAYAEPTPVGEFLGMALPSGRAALGPNFHFTDHLRGEIGDLLPWTAEIDGVAAEGVDLVKEDAEGRLLEVRIFMRPQTAIAAFSAAMSGSVGAFHGRGAR